MRYTLQTLLVLIAVLALSIDAESMAIKIVYNGTDCSGTPFTVMVAEFVDCQDEVLACSSFTVDSATYSTATTCENSALETVVAEAFAGFSYLLIETFSIECQYFLGANAYLASGECHIYEDTSDTAVIATVHEDGSASLGIYNDTSCSGTPFIDYTPDSETVSNHSCYNNYSVLYTDDGFVSTISQTSSSSGNVGNVGIPTPDEEDSQAGSAEVSITPSESKSGVNTGAIVGIAVAYVLLCVAGCILCFGRMERLAHRLGLRR